MDIENLRTIILKSTLPEDAKEAILLKVNQGRTEEELQALFEQIVFLLDYSNYIDAEGKLLQYDATKEQMLREDKQTILRAMEVLKGRDSTIEDLKAKISST